MRTNEPAPVYIRPILRRGRKSTRAQHPSSLGSARSYTDIERTIGTSKLRVCTLADLNEAGLKTTVATLTPSGPEYTPPSGESLPRGSRGSSPPRPGRRTRSGGGGGIRNGHATRRYSRGYSHAHTQQGHHTTTFTECKEPAVRSNQQSRLH